MKQLYFSISITALLTLAGFKTSAQAELGFSDSLDCTSYTYCVDLEINATAGNSFDVGTSSFLLKYDPAVVSFANYTPAQFDATTATCPNVWAAQRTDVDALKGEFGLTMKLLDDMGSCLTVEETPSIIGTVCFNVLAQGKVPNITFDAVNTLVNRSTPDNGTNAISLANVDTLNVPNSLACDCPGAGKPCDDLNVFTINDQYDNQCDCKGSLIDADVDGIYDGVDNCLDVFYEVEDGMIVGASIKNNQPMYYGTGFVDYANRYGDTLIFDIQIDSLGQYDLKFRYANASSDSLPRYLVFILDTTVIDELFAFPITGTSWGDWSEVVWTDSLTAGTHTITLLTNGKHGPNLDRVSVSSCGNCLQAGMACDDGDPCTSYDTYDTNCECKGIYRDSDNDGVCDVQDVCAGSDDNVDTDGDGIPDGCDDCDNNLIGTACDDNDPCTINDVYDANCNCAGTFNGNDADSDGVCDAYDACPGFDDAMDVDKDGIPDDCDPCNDLTVGQPCDDGNPCTVLDVIQPGCGCGGIPIYLELTFAVDSIVCHGGLANVDVTPEHMVGGIYFQWDHGAYTEDLTGVSPGTYIVTATDWRQCQITDTVVITEPSPIDLSFLTTASSGSDGAIDLTVGGGIAPYSFDWDSLGTAEDLTGLVPGRYYVTVADMLGCSANGAADVFSDSLCVDTAFQYEYGERVNTWVSYNVPPAMDGYTIFSNNNDPASVTHYYDFPEYGNYKFTISYTHIAANRQVNIYLDSTLVQSGLWLPKTNSWDTYGTVSFTVDSIPPGLHTIVTERFGTTNWNSQMDFIAVCKTATIACTPFVGTPCNDGDACTVNDTIDANCDCVGTYMDSDNDGVCDGKDICPGSPDTNDSDGDGIPDGCDDCHTYRYEAELAHWSGPTFKNNETGYSGTGFIDYRNINGDLLRFSINAPESGTYSFNIRYASNASNRYLDLSVNGVLHTDSLYFPHTGSWSNWEDLSFAADLCAGLNIIEMVTDSTHGPNIDFLGTCLPGYVNQPVIAKGNGSFEAGMSDWTRLHFWAAEPTKIDVSSENVHCGAQSGRSTGSAVAEQLYTDMEALKIDSVYTLHFYAAGGTATGYIGLPDFIYQGQSFEVDATSGNGGFVHHSITFTATGPTMRVWFDLHLNTPITFDAFSFDNAPCCNPNEDADNDSICDFMDACPGHNDLQDSDFDGKPDGCDTCYDWVYQTEEATLTGAVPMDDYFGYTGKGYIDFTEDTNDTVSFSIHAPVAGDYNVVIRYIAQDTLRKLDIWLDGQLAINDLSFPKTCNTWGETSFVKSLSAGTHEVVLVNDGHYGPKLDYVSLCLPGHVPTPVIADGNGSFENGFLNWSRMDDWSGDTSLVRPDSTKMFCGAISAFNDNTATYQQLYADIKYLMVDSVYTLHFYAAGGQADCYVGPVDDIYNGTYGFVDATAGNGEFMHQAVTFTATATTMRTWLDLYPNSPITVDAFSFDNAPCCDSLGNGGLVLIHDNPLTSGVYAKDNEIRSIANIYNSADVTFKATEGISLDTTFEVKLGSGFLAVIEDFCVQSPAPLIANEEGDGSIAFKPIVASNFVEIKTVEKVKGYEVYDLLGNNVAAGAGDKVDVSKIAAGKYNVLVVFENRPPVWVSMKL